jgi:hypothetical protein
VIELLVEEPAGEQYGRAVGRVMKGWVSGEET